jgi:hypothetical protein
MRLKYAPHARGNAAGFIWPLGRIGLIALALLMAASARSVGARDLSDSGRERQAAIRSGQPAKPALPAESAWDDQADGRISRLTDAIDRMHQNDAMAVDRRSLLAPPMRPERQDPFAPGAMTALSMALAIGALGILIRNQPARGSGLSSVEATIEARRTLFWCVAVLVVLNVFDLACTLLAVRTGGLLELNPIAEELTRSPILLVIFKLTVLGAVAAVLLRFWHYRLAQLVSWWASALYAVLAIRWATYSSMFLY